MRELSLNQFRTNLHGVVDKAIDDHQAIRIKRRSGKDFVVMSADDGEREQETMFVFRNQSLMSQIAESLSNIDKNSRGNK